MARAMTERVREGIVIRRIDDRALLRFDDGEERWQKSPAPVGTRFRAFGFHVPRPTATDPPSHSEDEQL